MQLQRGGPAHVDPSGQLHGQTARAVGTTPDVSVSAAMKPTTAIASTNRIFAIRMPRCLNMSFSFGIACRPIALGNDLGIPKSRRLDGNLRRKLGEPAENVS